MTEHRGAAAEGISLPARDSEETACERHDRSPRLAFPYVHFRRDTGGPACSGRVIPSPLLTDHLRNVTCPDCELWIERVIRKMLKR